MAESDAAALYMEDLGGLIKEPNLTPEEIYNTNEVALSWSIKPAHNLFCVLCYVSLQARFSIKYKFLCGSASIIH